MDDRLRGLERRFRESGALEDEAALLRAQMRTGALARSALVLAAYLGHAPARAALDLPAGPIERALVPLGDGLTTSISDSSPAERWLAGLCSWPEAGVRAWVATERAAGQADEHLLLEERALVCHCRAHRDWADRGVRRTGWAGQVYQDGVLTVPRGSGSSIALLGRAGFVAAARAELVPWALSREDPVAARLAAARPASRAQIRAALDGWLAELTAPDLAPTVARGRWRLELVSEPDGPPAEPLPLREVHLPVANFLSALLRRVPPDPATVMSEGVWDPDPALAGERQAALREVCERLARALCELCPVTVGRTSLWFDDGEDEERPASSVLELFDAGRRWTGWLRLELRDGARLALGVRNA